MTKTSEYFKFLSDEMSLQLLRDAQEGKRGLIPNATTKQFSSRLNKARKLRLIVNERGNYQLTTFGEFLLDKVRVFEEMDPTQWRFKAIDAQDDPEIKLKLIHQFFNKEPDDQITRPLSATKEMITRP